MWKTCLFFLIQSPLYKFVLEQKVEYFCSTHDNIDFEELKLTFCFQIVQLNLSGLAKCTISGQQTSAGRQGLYTGSNKSR
jgi:hypothetical protein